MYESFCAQCHGASGEGGVGPAFTSATFQDANSDDDLVATIDTGHSATSMIAWGEVLTIDQIQGLVGHIRALGGRGAAETIVYARDIAPILQASCAGCHGTSGGWDAATMDTVINSGDSGPAVVPGDPDGSSLVQRLRGEGNLMPPAGAIPASQIELIVKWIEGGATEEVTLGGGGEQAIAPDPGDLSWADHVQPILQASCAACHGTSGGWDGATYDSTVNSGNSGAAVIPGDADGSSLAQRLLGNGALMPPGTALPDDQIQLILDWINAGAAP